MILTELSWRTSWKSEGLKVVRYAFKGEADVMARDPEFSLEGMRFHLAHAARRSKNFTRR